MSAATVAASAPPTAGKAQTAADPKRILLGAVAMIAVGWFIGNGFLALAYYPQWFAVGMPVFDKIIQALLAMVLGIGGAVLFFYCMNVFVEGLPGRLGQFLMPYAWILPGYFTVGLLLLYPAVQTVNYSFANADSTAYVTPFRYQAEGKKQPVRPCLTNALPNRAGGLTVLCDMGANPDVEVDDMVRFAQMGSAYARVVLGIEHPRVGLLANGTEDEKGSNFTKACFPAMKAAVPGFVGNCEGTDITSGNFDVVVADGMSGNIALKATEGAAKFLLQELKGAFMSSLGTKIAALLIKKQMREIKAKLSGDAKGGAILLGLRGVVLIGHGATSVEAVKNGTLAAAEAVRAGLVENVANSMDGIVL